MFSKSIKKLQFMCNITPFVNKQLKQCGILCVPYSIYQSQDTFQRKRRLEQKQEKKEIVQIDTDSI